MILDKTIIKSLIKHLLQGEGRLCVCLVWTRRWSNFRDRLPKNLCPTRILLSAKPLSQLLNNKTVCNFLWNKVLAPPKINQVNVFFCVSQICLGFLGVGVWESLLEVTWADPGLALSSDWQIKVTSSVEVGPWRLITITQHGTARMKPALTTPPRGHNNTSRAFLSTFHSLFWGLSWLLSFLSHRASLQLANWLH